MSTGIKTMGALWERNAEFYGDREALVYGERRYFCALIAKLDFFAHLGCFLS